MIYANLGYEEQAVEDQVTALGLNITFSPGILLSWQLIRRSGIRKEMARPSGSRCHYPRVSAIMLSEDASVGVATGMNSKSSSENKINEMVFKEASSPDETFKVVSNPS